MPERANKYEKQYAKNATDTIEDIKNAQTEEAVTAIVGDDERTTVISAGTKRIADLAQAKTDATEALKNAEDAKKNADDTLEAREKAREKALEAREEALKLAEKKVGKVPEDEKLNDQLAHVQDAGTKLVKVKFLVDHEFNIAGEVNHMKAKQVAQLEMHVANQLANRRILHLI